MEVPPCIYCCIPNTNPSLEHVIPEVLGGTITTREVCRQCNSNLGAQVDAPFSESLYMRLIRFNFKDFLSVEAIPEFRLDGELVSHGGEERIRGHLRFAARGIEFQPIFDKKVEGKITTYIVPDTPEGQKAFQGLLTSRTKNIQHAEWVDLPPVPECFVIAGEVSLAYQRELIKMFLGFLASEVSPSVATDSRFDSARAFLRGNQRDLAGEGFDMRTGVSTKPLHILDAVGHEIGFVIKDGHPLFSVTLFDSAQFQMKVGEQLPVLPDVRRRISLPRRHRTLGVPLFRLFPPSAP